jgi:membrane protease YdiL (CAAX protease family)
LSTGPPAAATGPDPAPDELPDGSAARTSGPPGSGTFSLEGRPAPGLYLIAWLLAGAGIAVAFIATLTVPPVSGVLFMAGLLLVGLGLAAGAGYQVMARSRRDAGAYRGPSPVIVFGVLFVFANSIGLALFSLGIADLATVPGFVVGAVTLFVGYLLAVWLFVIRTGSLTWSDMGLTGWSLREHLASAGLGIGLMVPVTFIALLIGGIVAQLVNAQPPAVVPTPDGTAEVLAVGLAAAILVPVGEEIFFRGFALTAWLRDRGPRTALVWSALFFTLVHIANITAGFEEGARQALLQSAVILPLGFVLGWLFLQRGLVAAIAGHVTYNGLVLLLATVAQRFLPTPAG